jgi:hypothetical protein
MRWASVVCFVAFHKWVRRWDEREREGVHVCVRCGKVLDRPDGLTRRGGEPGGGAFVG